MILVKITQDEDGEKVENAKWCLSIVETAGNMAFCSGQFYGEGESTCKYLQKEKGKITCPHCIEKIKMIKAIKL